MDKEKNKTFEPNLEKVPYPENVPYIVHESAIARMERINKRLWTVLILVICLFVATNAAWIWYENQFEDISVDQEVDTGEGTAYVAGVGDVYGEGKAESESPSP